MLLKTSDKLINRVSKGCCGTPCKSFPFNTEISRNQWAKTCGLPH